VNNVHHVYQPEVIVVHGKRLGRHIEHDQRSLAYGVVLSPGPLKSAMWQRHCDPFDQGNIGSCTGNAIAGAAMSGPLWVTGRLLTEADALRLYGAATRLDKIPGHYPPDDTGSSGLAAAKAAHQAGLIGSYHHAFGLLQALHAVAAGPCIAGINWYEGFDSPEGDEAVCSISGQIRGGHEVCVDEIDVPNGMLGFTNSWGFVYGNKGRARMSFRTFGTLLQERGDVVAPQPLTPAP
jgi:hypothetical protein